MTLRRAATLAMNLSHIVSGASTLSTAAIQDRFPRLHITRTDLVCSLLVEAFKNCPLAMSYLNHFVVNISNIS